jgi:LPXTG-motif cell wall-anchored protein
MNKEFFEAVALMEKEKGIQAIMDEYGCTREEAIEIMNEEIQNSRKPVRSSNEFNNEVATGELVIVNSVANKQSKKDKFEYVVVYSEVFGGTSEAAYYEGTYYVENEDGKETKKTAKDGKITLKANEKAIIKGIPSATKVAVQQENLKEGYSIEAIDATENFDSDEEKGLAVGNIVKDAKNEDANEIVFSIESEKKQENVDPKELDESPKTSDSMTLAVMIIAALSFMGATIVFIKRKNA